MPLVRDWDLLWALRFIQIRLSSLLAITGTVLERQFVPTLLSVCTWIFGTMIDHYKGMTRLITT